MENVVIVSAGRTAIGKFDGIISSVSAVELGSIVIKDLMNKIKLNPVLVDQVILGNVLTAGTGQNPARQTAIKAGLPVDVCAVTINEVCGSGLKAISLGAQAIKCNDAEIVIAGGQENMYLAPHILNQSRKGLRIGNWYFIDSMLKDGIMDAFYNYQMGITAENIADKYKIKREEQDVFAYKSQRKASMAQTEGIFDSEIIPINLENKNTIFNKDEFLKLNTSIDVLSKLRPIFKKDGTVTAGNSSGINNGAAAVILMSESKANKLGIKPLASIITTAEAGVEPSFMGLGPIYASKKALKKTNMSVSDLDLIESNEAFAAQSIIVDKFMEWDINKVNVNGGAIALGHPIGASGARILITLLFEMKRRFSKLGLATLCIGGGMGISMIIENYQ